MLIERWKRGVGNFFEDELISFYTYFTLIFAECAYLWTVCEKTLAIQFTVILLGYVLNVVLCAWLKGETEGTKLEVVISIYYIIAFAMLCVAACFINAKMAIAMTAIPLVYTALCIGITRFPLASIQRYATMGITDELCKNKILFTCLRIVFVGAPLVAFAICLAQIPTLDVAWKIIIPIVYTFCIPLFALYEDCSAALNIFELAFEIS